MRISHLIQPDSYIENETYRRALERAVEETQREFAQRRHVELDVDLRDLPSRQTETPT